MTMYEYRKPTICLAEILFSLRNLMSKKNKSRVTIPTKFDGNDHEWKGNRRISSFRSQDQTVVGQTIPMKGLNINVHS